MSRRAWCYVAALGLTLAGSGQAQESEALSRSQVDANERSREGAQDGENRATEEQSEPVDLSPSLQGIEAAIRELVAEEYEPEQRAQDDRERRDLAAQEAMALWAEGMAYLTGATVVLTFVGLLALIRTLHHTRRAADYTASMLEEAKETTAAARASVRETERAAQAAEAAVAVTREMSQAQVRAYISISLGDFEGWPLRIAPNEPAHVPVRFTNSGQSPARHCSCAIDLRLTGNDFGTREEDFNGMVPAAQPIGADIAAGSEHTTLAIARVPLPPRDFDLMTDPEVGINFFAFGLIRYEDVFRQSHTTRFCRRFRFTRDPNVGDPGAFQLNFDTTPCHNDSD